MCCFQNLLKFVPANNRSPKVHCVLVNSQYDLKYRKLILNLPGGKAILIILSYGIILLYPYEA